MSFLWEILAQNHSCLVNKTESLLNKKYQNREVKGFFSTNQAEKYHWVIATCAPSQGKILHSLKQFKNNENQRIEKILSHLHCQLVLTIHLAKSNTIKPKILLTNTRASLSNWFLLKDCCSVICFSSSNNFELVCIVIFPQLYIVSRVLYSTINFFTIRFPIWWKIIIEAITENRVIKSWSMNIHFCLMNPTVMNGCYDY